MSHPLDQADLRVRVQARIDRELQHQRQVLAELGPDVDRLVDVISALLTGGKRLRPAFAYWGYRSAGEPDSDALVSMATAMELFQAAALLHDDVMDDSDTRRGMPSAHRTLATDHSRHGWGGDEDRFGLSGAILAGNLCLTWSDSLYAGSGLPAPALERGRETFDQMRTQLMAGQFLDVIESVRPWSDIDTAERMRRAHAVLAYKSAKYTVEHPLLIGARAAGLGERDCAALADYGLALGKGFQLRDDVLGVYGDPVETGKPAGDDIREGKRTVLIAHALDALGNSDAALLEAALGSPEVTDAQIEQVRVLLDGCGALAATERDIAGFAAAAERALAQASTIDSHARSVLSDLISYTTARTH